MHRANLSYEQTISYLEELHRKGLLEKRVEESTPVYRMTEKGKEFLDAFTKLSALIEGEGVEVYEQYHKKRG